MEDLPSLTEFVNIRATKKPGTRVEKFQRVDDRPLKKFKSASIIKESSK